MWIVLAFISAICLGFYDVSKKIALRDNKVVDVLMLSTCISSLILAVPLVLSRIHPEWMLGTPFYVPRLDLTAHLYTLLKSVIVLSSWVFAYISLKHLPISVVSPVQATRPMWTLVGAMLIFGERLNTWQWIGVVLAIGTIFVFSFGATKKVRHTTLFHEHKYYYICLALAILIGAASGLYDKYLMRRYDHNAVQVYYTLYQAVMMIVVWMIDRFAKRQKTASLKEQRQVTIGRIIFVLCLMSFVLCPAKAKAKAKADSIYCGTQLKLDIASPIVMSAANNWKIQHYELAVNVRLAKRFYPTFEAGYSGGQTTNDTILYRGQGGFFRIGADLCPFKKHPESPHALLVGVRLGTAAQQWQHPDYGTGGVRGDCWGEIVAGCQVEIAKVNKTSFYMGWMGRFKCLFTRTLTSAEKKTAPENLMDANPYMPAYIPGFGKRDNIGWGLNYYLGWRF